MAIKKIQEGDEQNTTRASSKVIILISDGEDFGEETEKAEKEIENENIKLYTLGIGTEQGGKIYASNGYKRDRNGEVVITKLNSRSLRSLADKTGGQYFEINESRNDVSRLINSISKIEGELRDARFVDVAANRYFYFLGLALILLAIDMLLAVQTVRI